MFNDDGDCISECSNCPYFFRYDVCGPENSTIYLDYYESYRLALREEIAVIMKDEVCTISFFSSVLSAVDISDRQKRRLVVLLVIDALKRIRNAEVFTKGWLSELFPDSNEYISSEETIGLLSDAIDKLSDAY